MYTRQDVIASARSYIGTKFKLYGREPHHGLDCVGLLYRVGTDLGIPLKDSLDYSRKPEAAKIEAALQQYTRAVTSPVPRNGQVLKIRQFMFPMHLGFLCVENGRMTVINANSKKGAVVEDPFKEWASLILEHREIIGVR